MAGAESGAEGLLVGKVGWSLGAAEAEAQGEGVGKPGKECAQGVWAGSGGISVAVSAWRTTDRGV